MIQLLKNFRLFGRGGPGRRQTATIAVLVLLEHLRRDRGFVSLLRLLLLFFLPFFLSFLCELLLLFLLRLALLVIHGHVRAAVVAGGSGACHNDGEPG